MPTWLQQRWNKVLRSPLVLLCLSIATLAIADEYRLDNYGADEGLDVEFTKSIDQDAYGFIWIATDRGLYRYDGENFLFLHEGLPSPYVKSFFHDDAGHLYAISDEGVVLVNTDIQNPSVEVVIQGATSFQDSAVTYPKHGLVDNLGNIWVSEQRGVVKYREGKFKRYLFPEEDYAYDFLRSFSILDGGVNGLYVLSLEGNCYRYASARADLFLTYKLTKPIGQISSTLKLDDQHFLVGGTRGLFELTLPDSTETIHVRTLVFGLDVSSLSHDNQGGVYIGTWAHGLYHFNPEKPRTSLVKIEAYQYIKVNHLFMSRDGLWISTDTGISLLQRTDFSSIENQGLNTYIHDIKEGEDGSLYFCDGARIMRLPDPTVISHLDTVYFNNKTTIVQLQLLRGYMYISTSRGDVLKVRNGKAVKSLPLTYRGRSALTMVQDGKGQLWATQTLAVGVNRIDLQDRVTLYGSEKGLSFPIQAIRYTSTGLYATTVEHDTLYLYLLDEKEERFQQILNLPLASTDRPHEAYDIAEGPKGSILIGTTDGLYRWDSTRISRVDLQLEKGNEIRAIAAHPDGDLWIGTRSGVLRYSKDAILSYSTSDGLPARTISRHSIMVDRRGEIWMGTSLGVAWTKSSTAIYQTPKPLLVQVFLDGERVRSLDDISLTPSSLFELHYASLSYPGDAVRYQQRILIRGDEPWSEPGSKPITFLNRLQPGEYTWQVRAKRQGNATWSEALTFPIHVNVHWFATWWALLALSTVLLVTYAIVIRWRTRKLVREKERLERLIGQRTRQALEQLERSKNAELEAQQMRITNRIAGTIAHEFNNPLAIIQASLDLLKTQDLKPEDRLAFERIQNQTVRMRDLVRKLLKLQGLHEIDYAAGMKIVNIHGEEREPPSPESSHKNEE